MGRNKVQESYTDLAQLLGILSCDYHVTYFWVFLKEKNSSEKNSDQKKKKKKKKIRTFLINR